MCGRWTWVCTPASLTKMLDKLASSDERDTCLIIDVLVKTDIPNYDSLFITHIPKAATAHLYIVNYAELGESVFDVCNSGNLSLRNILQSSTIKKAVHNTTINPALVYMRHWIQMAGVVSIDLLTLIKQERARLLWDEIIAVLGFDLGLRPTAYGRCTKGDGSARRLFPPHTVKQNSLPSYSSSNSKRWNNSLPKVDIQSTTGVIDHQINSEDQNITTIHASSSTDLGAGEIWTAEYRPFHSAGISAQPAPTDADRDERIVEDTMIALCYRMALMKPKMRFGITKGQSRPRFPDETQYFRNDICVAHGRKGSPKGKGRAKISDNTPDLFMEAVGNLNKVSDVPGQYFKDTNATMCISRTSSTIAQQGSVYEESCPPDYEGGPLIDEMEDIQINSDVDEEEDDDDDFELVTIESEKSWDMIDSDS